MNKRHLHHVWTWLRRISPWYFLGLALIMVVVSVGALRSNNQHMLDLRNAVYSADEQGVGVAEALQELQTYVTSHMNTSLTTRDGVYPPVQLKYTYDRLVRAEGDKVAQQNQAQYNEAVAHCPSSGNSYQQHLDQQNCVIAYMQDKHNLTLPAIPDALYKFDFVSPAWSMDLAGWSIVATVVSFALFVILLIADFWFKKNIV
jgi:preprotein translocase subunit SecF